MLGSLSELLIVLVNLGENVKNVIFLPDKKNLTPLHLIARYQPDSIYIPLLQYFHKYRTTVLHILFHNHSLPAPLLKDTDKITDANYLIVDSVYGDRNHEPKDERDERFRKIIMEAINSKGNVIIPAFSIERTQVILYELNNLIESKKIPSVPVFLDSPLAEKVTEIYSKKSTAL